VITSSLFSISERVFWFGTLIASKNSEGASERFKIMNPNKIPCTVKATVTPRTQSKSEGFAFSVKPDVPFTIEPHKHKYVTVTFMPEKMMSYGALFEAKVENGDPQSKTGKLQFEVRGEGTLPTLQVAEPTEVQGGTPVLRFKETRVGKETVLPIVLRNDGAIPATARFDLIKEECFSFLGNLNYTVTPKSYPHFQIAFTPKEAKTYEEVLTFQTANNPFEQHRVLLVGKGQEQFIDFEGLPGEEQDELCLGDCIVNKPKSVVFNIVNNGDKPVRFKWNMGDKEGFRFFPSVGHLKARASKQIKVAFKATQQVKHDKVPIQCEVQQIT